jgi:lipopolysaccharide heptosyltransferase I
MDDFLIIRLSSLGDIIHTLPAFSALRRHFPGSRISWLVEPKGKEILDLVPGIDGRIVRGEKGWLRKLRMRDRTALDFQGLVKSGTMAFLSRARRRIGFSRENLREPLASVFYTERLEAIPEDGHVIQKNLRLLGRLGIGEEAWDFPILVPQETNREIEQELQKIGYTRSKKLVLCNVGAAWETKRLSEEKWTRILRLLKSDALFPLLLWGNPLEKEFAVRISREADVPASPPLSIKQAIALISAAALLISGDTFALQAACALSVPVVGLFGPTNPRRNGPFSPRDRIIYFSMGCNPCYKRTCSSLKCLREISPEEVAAKALEILKADE